MTQRYRRIILHAGLGKTGTTSIQGNCYRHRALLLQHGIVYPCFKFGKKQMVNHSDCLIAAVCDKPGKYGSAVRQHVPDNPEIFSDELKPQVADILENPEADTLVFSGEAVAEFDDNDMQLLRQKLQAHCDELKVIAYIRSPQSSLESILQQRVKSNHIIDPETLVSVVRQRYEMLEKIFGDILTVANFHTAVTHEFGLVGHFIESIGIPKDKLKGLDFSTSNERVSMEAYRIMLAINNQFPRGDTKNHGVIRKPHDMHSLTEISGQPFQLENFVASTLYQKTLDESALLESKLGFQFPKLTERRTGQLWQNNCLISLENAIRKLNNKKMEIAAAEFLCQEADQLDSTQTASATILRHIAWSLENIPSDPTKAILEDLGADYFKFSALQAEPHSTELALKLMSLADILRPNAKLIQTKLALYNQKVVDS